MLVLQKGRRQPELRDGRQDARLVAGAVLVRRAAVMAAAVTATAFAVYPRAVRSRYRKPVFWLWMIVAVLAIFVVNGLIVRLT